MESQDRIYIIDNKEIDRITGQEVFRDTDNRPYILEKIKSKPMSVCDLCNLYCGLLRRIVKDASGPTLVDGLTTIQDQIESRSYLVNGYLEMNGHYVYDAPNDSSHRLDSKYMRIIQTKDAKRSNVSLEDIFQYTDMDYTLAHKFIKNWASSGWSREHEFYNQVMEAT